jgi:hypothetical protein
MVVKSNGAISFIENADISDFAKYNDFNHADEEQEVWRCSRKRIF